MKKLTLKLLKRLNACDAGIKFVKRNNLLGLRLDKLHLIEGDFKEYKSYLMTLLNGNPRYTYDSFGRELTFKDGDYYGTKTYHTTGRLLTYEDSTGYFEKYTYTESGDILTYETSKGYFEKYTYTESGDTLTYENSKPYSESYTYDELGHISTYENSDNFSRTYTCDTSGNKLTYKDSTGVSWIRTYDHRNKLLSHDSKDLNEKYTYNESGQVLTYYKNENLEESTVKYTYDKFGRPLTAKYSDGSYVKYRYDRRGNLLILEHYTKTRVGYSKSIEVRTYDKRNNLLTSKRTRNDKYEYESHTYDKFGNELTYNHSDGSFLIRKYDERGNFLSIEGGAEFEIYSYEYKNNRLYKMYTDGELILSIPEECFT